MSGCLCLRPPPKFTPTPQLWRSDLAQSRPRSQQQQRLQQQHLSSPPPPKLLQPARPTSPQQLPQPLPWSLGQSPSVTKFFPARQPPPNPSGQQRQTNPSRAPRKLWRRWYWTRRRLSGWSSCFRQLKTACVTGGCLCMPSRGCSRSCGRGRTAVSTSRAAAVEWS